MDRLEKEDRDTAPKRVKTSDGIGENSGIMIRNLFSQCHPISDLEDLELVVQEPPSWINRVEPLLSRSPTVLQNHISDCHSSAAQFSIGNRIDLRSTPKTLVCHDYKGGYHADKYLQNPNEDMLGNGYTFYNWAQIDIFVYFSHHLITIPPLCWINAGHSQGVKVLGTLITEFDKGKVMCDQKIFINSGQMRAFARSLAQITRLFGFDGWLLNIENKVENIVILKEFVPYFTSLVHEVNPGHLVIWYDSVTDEGELSWQNELNEKNRYFFDSCDGIFLNYSWSEKHLINSVVASQHRKTDVFVGVDVFGRNMYGGGQFNTYKAVELASRLGLSVALFAPGWTHETLPKTDKFFENFLNNDSAFWTSLWPYLYTHPICNYFSTNFYIGLDERCYNIFSQQNQLSKFLYPKVVTAVPNYEGIPTLSRKCGCIQSTIVNSKNACLITNKNLRKDIDYIHHLFITDIEIVDNTVVYCLTKTAEELPNRLNFTLILSDYNGCMKIVKLLSESKREPLVNSSIIEVNPTEAVDVIENIRGRHLKMIKEGHWEISAYLFSTGLSNVLEIGCTIVGGNAVYLGAFGIQNADGNFLKNL